LIRFVSFVIFSTVSFACFSFSSRLAPSTPSNPMSREKLSVGFGELPTRALMRGLNDKLCGLSLPCGVGSGGNGLARIGECDGVEVELVVVVIVEFVGTEVDIGGDTEDSDELVLDEQAASGCLA
jgi:hypothetical protein